MLRSLPTIFIILLCTSLGHALEHESKVGIILIGDTGLNNEHRDKVALSIKKFCERELCSFALLLGDNFYYSGVSSLEDEQFVTKFEEPYGNLGFTFYPVLGNHDVKSNWQAQIEYQNKSWSMPARYYKVDNALADIYALDTNFYTDKISKSSRRQHRWLNKELTKSNAPWTIVYGHHPVYSYGQHGDTEGLIEHIEPLLEKHNVDFFISGHDHDRQLIEIDNVHYIVSGAGANPRDVGTGEGTLFANGKAGFAYLLLTPKSATISFLNSNAEVEFSKVINK